MRVGHRNGKLPNEPGTRQKGDTDKISSPTESEIAAACAEIRRGWSFIERKRRIVGCAETQRATGDLRLRIWRPPVVARAEVMQGLSAVEPAAIENRLIDESIAAIVAAHSL